jgi:hypothetical protein
MFDGFKVGVPRKLIDLLLLIFNTLNLGRIIQPPLNVLKLPMFKRHFNLSSTSQMRPPTSYLHVKLEILLLGILPMLPMLPDEIFYLARHITKGIM